MCKNQNIKYIPFFLKRKQKIYLTVFINRMNKIEKYIYFFNNVCNLV